MLHHGVIPGLALRLRGTYTYFHHLHRAPNSMSQGPTHVTFPICLCSGKFLTTLPVLCIRAVHVPVMAEIANLKPTWPFFDVICVLRHLHFGLRSMIYYVELALEMS